MPLAGVFFSVGEGPRLSKQWQVPTAATYFPFSRGLATALPLASNLSRVGSLGCGTTPSTPPCPGLGRELSGVPSPLPHHFQPTQILAPRSLASGGEGPVLLYPTPTLSCLLTSPDPERKGASPGWLLLHTSQGPIHQVPCPQGHIMEFLQLLSQSTAKGRGREGGRREPA